MYFGRRRSTKDALIRHDWRSGSRFPEMGCILEHQICRFAKMILRNRCSTCGLVLAWPQFFMAGRQVCTELSTFEVSQNCFAIHQFAP